MRQQLFRMFPSDGVRLAATARIHSFGREHQQPLHPVHGLIRCLVRNGALCRTDPEQLASEPSDPAAVAAHDRNWIGFRDRSKP